ncbi:hypothetical protein SLW70_13130 [Flavobacterium sp. NG2]|uniref:hypothetical protein n=1 Tax=Flavobacterium sp. NG2 TaxID=3097547 RepID=UPI002A821C32|nr:hypothetical protein [Flavobacterium sp. NG2]WPR70867.1 hypothetical protein SLW70_13130 [Flavobacterium sp. NG2]
MKRKYGVKNLKLNSFLTTILMPVIWTALFIGIGYGIVNPILRAKKFNSKDWVENVNSRYRMINDLKENVLIGKNKTEVLKILGKSDGECGYRSTEDTICYLVPDPDDPGFLDHYELVILFDEFGKVVEVTSELM